MDYLITDLKQYIGSALIGVSEYQAVTVMVGLIALLILILPGRRTADRIFTACLILYLYMVFSTTVLIRAESGAHKAMLMPFWSYRKAITSSYFRYEVLENILLFVPAGLLLGILKGRPASILYLMLFSIAIEALQYSLRVGLCEFDDVFNNTLGSAIGYVAGWIISRITRR